MKRLLMIGSALILMSACATGDSDEAAEQDGRPAEAIYAEAAALMDDGKYKQAAPLFEDVERQHPYSEWATRAQLMAAYAWYKDRKYDEALLALDRFIELHPGNKDVDYAHYLKALSYYEQITDVARDQAMTADALTAFDTLVNRFPDSRYARDAILKRDLTNDHLAGKEMDIGRYYLNRGEINAAINRFRKVVTDYQTTMHVPEALHRLVEAYTTLGLKGEAVRVAAVLGYNYPGSPWYEDSYKILDPEQRQQILEDRGFVDRTVDTLFKPD